MLWRASHTDTAKAAILGLIDVIHVRQSQGVSRRRRHSFGPAVWERAERMETMRASAWIKAPRNQPGDGWQVVRSREYGSVGKKERERVSLGMAVGCASRCVGFWVYRVVTDCHRFDRLRFAR